MTEQAVHFEAPRGMRDFYPEDMRLRKMIFEAWLQSAREFGFLQYDACVVESLDLLKRKGGEEIVEQIYAFKDKSNRDLALRPEMTPTLARMVAARRGQLTFPLKWFAVAQCFRYERMSRGRKREHYQWNLDVVGEPALTAECEVLSCAVGALLRLGLQKSDFKVLINSRALLVDLLLRAGVASVLHAAVFLALDKRGKLPDEEMRLMLQQAGLDASAIEAVFRMLGMQSLDEVALALDVETPALAGLRQVQSMLAQYGLADCVQFDIGVVRGLGYYTGLVFEAFDSARKFRAIFGGGRYDNLLGDLSGAPLTAVGLGFGDVVIAELLAEKGGFACCDAALDCAVGYMEQSQHDAACRIACKMRANGQAVDLALHPEKPRHFFSRVGGGGFRKAVYIGPDDLERGSVRVKNLLDRTEEEKTLADMFGL